MTDGIRVFYIVFTLHYIHLNIYCSCIYAIKDCAAAENSEIPRLKENGEYLQKAAFCLNYLYIIDMLC